MNADLRREAAQNGRLEHLHSDRCWASSWSRVSATVPTTFAPHRMQVDSIRMRSPTEGPEGKRCAAASGCLEPEAERPNETFDTSAGRRRVAGPTEKVGLPNTTQIMSLWRRRAKFSHSTRGFALLSAAHGRPPKPSIDLTGQCRHRAAPPSPQPLSLRCTGRPNSRSVVRFAQPRPTYAAISS
jgi:hypothetical protein